jgi:hypothetical protein
MIDREPAKKMKANPAPVIKPKTIPGEITNIPASPKGGKEKLTKEQRNRLMMVGGGILALLLAAGLMVDGLLNRNASATKNGGSLDPNNPNYAGGLAPTATVEVIPTPTAEQTPIPTATPEQASTYEQQVAALEIPAGLSAEELAKVLVEDRWTKWANAGVATETESKEFENDWYAYPTSDETGIEAFTKAQADENAEVFIDALYTDDWEDRPDLVSFIERDKRTNYLVLRGYMATAWTSYSKDIEPYKNWFEVSSVRETSTGQNERTLVIEAIQHANDDKNSMDPLVGGGDISFTVTLQKDKNGTEKIVAASY